MFKGLGNLASVMRQAQHLGDKMEEVKARLRSQRATADAGAGLVEVEVNGLGKVLRVHIDPSLMKPDQQEMAEDLVVAAVKQASEKAQALHAEAMKSLAAGLDVPGLTAALENVAEDSTGRS
jgi:hypothetical protein